MFGFRIELKDFPHSAFGKVFQDAYELTFRMLLKVFLNNSPKKHSHTFSEVDPGDVTTIKV